MTHQSWESLTISYHLELINKILSPNSDEKANPCLRKILNESIIRYKDLYMQKANEEQQGKLNNAFAYIVRGWKNMQIYFGHLGTVKQILHIFQGNNQGGGGRKLKKTMQMPLWINTNKKTWDGRTLWKNSKTGKICVKTMVSNNNGERKAKYMVPPKK